MTANPSTGLTGGRYTLPAELGGYECEITDGLAKPGGRVDCVMDIAGGGVTVKVNLPFRLLTPVKPPLPPEPPDGSVVRITQLRPGAPAPAGLRFPAHFFQRERGRLHSWRGLDPNGYDWEWEGICELGDPVLLVPDPFAEPVQLPWRKSGFEVSVSGAMVEIVMPRAEDGGTTLVGHCLAREFARAVWAGLVTEHTEPHHDRPATTVPS